LPQTTVNLGVKEAYAKAKEALVKQGCVVISEEQPHRLVACQGSLWGISPRTAKKTVTATFEVAGDKTNIVYSSRLASDWKNVTIIGCIIAAALVALCIWMVLDLSEFMTTGTPSFWSWLIMSGGTTELNTGEAFVNLASGLSVFLIIIIVVEAVIYVYADRNIDVFAQTTFGQLS